MRVDHSFSGSGNGEDIEVPIPESIVATTTLTSSAAEINIALPEEANRIIMEYNLILEADSTGAELGIYINGVATPTYHTSHFYAQNASAQVLIRGPRAFFQILGLGTAGSDVRYFTGELFFRRTASDIVSVLGPVYNYTKNITTVQHRNGTVGGSLSTGALAPFSSFRIVYVDSSGNIRPGTPFLTGSQVRLRV